jgi:hypothetical protein
MKVMKSVATPSPVKIELVGGIHDGEILILEEPKKVIKVGDEKYTQAYEVNRFGREVYRCSSGDGKLKQSFFEKKI